VRSYTCAMETRTAETRKTVTILFADIVASTELGDRLDPEALRQVVSRYFSDMAAVLEQHGGTVEKFIGDEVMAVFGVPSAHEDDALRAVRAAAAMRRKLADLNEELAPVWGATLETRIAINTGEVVAGDASLGHGFVTGDAVTLTKRIQQAAAPGEILMGTATHELVCHAAHTTRVGPFTLKGKSDPVFARRLEEVDLVSEAFARRLDAPLIGRSREVTRLDAAYRRAVSTRSTQMVTILGPPGIGKSRLAHELFDHVGGEATVRMGRCLPYGEGITYWPVREILPEETFEGTAEEIFWRIRKDLEALAEKRPLVVCFEDAHWGEATFFDLVQYLFGWIRDRQVLLLCVARPELLERRPDWPDDEEDAWVLPVGPLSEEDTRALLDSLAAPTDARDRIAHAAEGNPLFVEQMAAMAIDDGANIPVPPSIRALLTARLDRLRPDEATLLERASVIGRDFPLHAVLELAPEALRSRASAVLLGLVRKDLVRPHPVGDEDGFSFRHVLIRDAAYEAVPKQLRAELHAQHADWLEASGYAEILVGYHLEQAVMLQRQLGLHGDGVDGLALRAGSLLGAAGRRAYRRGDMPAARGLLERALELLPDEREPTLDLRRALATVLWQVGEVAESDALLESVRDEAVRGRDRRLEWATRLDLSWRRAMEQAGALELQTTAESAIPVFEELGDEASLARARRALGIVAIRAGRYGDAQEHLESAIERGRPSESARERAHAADALCTTLLYGPEEASTAVSKCRALLHGERENLLLEANVSTSLAGLVAMRGGFDEARSLYERARVIFGELGFRMPLAGMTQVTGPIELLAGDALAAERELREGLEILTSAGVDGGPLAPQAAFLAAALLAQGRIDEAREFADLSEKSMSGEDLPSRILVRTVRAHVGATLGEGEDALIAARDAIEVAERTDALNLTGDAYVALAVVHEGLGSVDDAAAATAAARELYRRKGNRVALRRIESAGLVVTDRTR
jgi:class 3 adenylate cyclase/tetratricopeptide (TPR) repeat protein